MTGSPFALAPWTPASPWSPVSLSSSSLFSARKMDTLGCMASEASFSSNALGLILQKTILLNILYYEMFYSTMFPGKCDERGPPEHLIHSSG